MDQLKEFKPSIFTPKKVDSNGYDEEGVLHDKCGSPDCCQKCDTAVGEQDAGQATDRPNIS